MRAQVTTVEASPARLDDAIRFFREQVLPRLRQMDGFEEFIVLSARRSGKLLGVALWESEEALRATAEDDSGSSGAANAAGGTVVSVEEYEDFVNEAPSAGRWARSRAK
jgi:heme-degrading monooxygenase HmoA